MQLACDTSYVSDGRLDLLLSLDDQEVTTRCDGKKTQGI